MITPDTVAELDEAIDAAAATQHRLEHGTVPLLNAPTPAELKEQRASHRRTRRAELREQEAARTAKVKRRSKERALDDELADAEHQDQLWARRALSSATRLTSPTARLASLYRAYRMQVGALLAVAITGVVWGAVNVQHGIVKIAHLNRGDPQWWLAYLVEPLVTVPLLVVLAFQATLAEWGKRPTGGERARLLAVEGVLLGVAIALQIGPHAKEGIAAVLFAIPPMMIAASMFMLPVISRRLGALLLTARAEVDELTGQAEGDRSATTSTGQRTGQDTEPETNESTAADTAEPTTDPTGQDLADTVSTESDRSATPADRSANAPTTEPTTPVSTENTEVSDRSATSQHAASAHADVDIDSTEATGQHTGEPPADHHQAKVPGQPTGQESVPTTVGELLARSPQHAPAPRPEPERPSEQTVELTDETVVEQLLAPVAEALRPHEDWLSREDVRRVTGCGSTKSARLLVALNERTPDRPNPQPRRPGRNDDIDNAQRAALHPAAAN